MPLRGRQLWRCRTITIGVGVERTHPHLLRPTLGTIGTLLAAPHNVRHHRPAHDLPQGHNAARQCPQTYPLVCDVQAHEGKRGGLSAAAR